MNNNFKTIIFILVIIVIGLGLFVLLKDQNDQAENNGDQNVDTITVNSYKECVDAGYPVEESYPARCTVPGGETFMQDVGNEIEKGDLIRIDSPRPGDSVSGEDVISVTGEARGYWFFEASFPIEVIDASGNVVGTGIATADGDWMTEDFVPYVAEITIEEDYTGEANLVLRRDNPSGLPENEDALIVPITLE